MTKIYNLQTPQSVIPKQWHRSYPPSSVSGTGWMLDALDDLAEELDGCLLSVDP